MNDRSYFDPRQLSDGELQAKLSQAYTILSRGGLSFGLRSQLQNMIESLLAENRERAEHQLREDLLKQGIDIAPSINITKD